MSERVKHTPGPWQVWQEHASVYAGVEANLPYRVAGKHLRRIAECGNDDLDPDCEDDDAFANARLVAAAPDLLRALRHMRFEVWGMVEMARECIGNTNANALIERCQDALAVMAKAEGRDTDMEAAGQLSALSEG